MKKIKNNNGFTLVELLAVIVVLAIVMGIAAVAITNTLNSTRKNSYVADAQQYIAGARTLVNTDMVEIMLGGTSEYAPACNSTNPSTTISLSKIKTDADDNDKSPYGLTIDKTKSLVKVQATYDATSGDCTYSYSIYLTDGVNRIGTSSAPVAESSLSSSSVELESE